jgi:hypothetical protein
MPLFGVGEVAGPRVTTANMCCGLGGRSWVAKIEIFENSPVLKRYDQDGTAVMWFAY